MQAAPNRPRALVLGIELYHFAEVVVTLPSRTDSEDTGLDLYFVSRRPPEVPYSSTALRIKNLF